MPMASHSLGVCDILNAFRPDLGQVDTLVAKMIGPGPNALKFVPPAGY